jgi:hypothetical protein
MRKLMLGVVALATAVMTACDPSTPAGVNADARLSGGSGGGGGGGGGGGTGGSGGSSTPTFLVADPNTANSNIVSFYAKAGSDRVGEIFVNGSSGGNGDRIVRLRIKSNAQIVLPNGTKLATGDSVLITMQVTDLTTLATHFEPAGIQFKGNSVAQLAMWYNHTNAAATTPPGLAIWKQETSTSPWIKQTSTVDAVTESVSAYIPGFTNYVIAY